MKKLLLAGLIIFSVSHAQDRVVKIFHVKQEPRLTMEVGPAKVIIETHDSSSIILETELPKGDLYAVTTTQDGDKIHVKLEPGSTLGWMLQPLTYLTQEVTFYVKVPASCCIVLDTWGSRMEIRGVNGEIRARSGSEVTRLIRSFFKLSQG
jgi:hypothetical protein